VAVIHKLDSKNKFMSAFDPKTGHYMRTGVLIQTDDGKLVDSGIDPFMTDFPELIDVGIMGHCIHGASGLCVKSGVECYQNGLGTKVENMTLENFKRIVDECKGKTFQFALGGRGDVNKYEHFEEALKYANANSIVPNYTTSGLDLTDREVQLTKEYCGAVAVSWYRSEYTLHAIDMFLKAGIKTNIHYVLGNNSIDEAIERLQTPDGFPSGINAIIFLLHKPVGLGSQDNVLSPDDLRVKQFFDLIDGSKFPYKIGFDSCSVPGLINNTKHLNPDSFDTCEGGRWSMYITSDMLALPCSFDNQEKFWGYDINTDTVHNAWHSAQFDAFRDHFRNSCPNCKNRLACMGGCAIRREIVLCSRDEKELI
jgi:radical SAM protein with 4Fe4S-binding SPASM domain